VNKPAEKYVAFVADYEAYVNLHATDPDWFRNQPGGYEILLRPDEIRAVETSQAEELLQKGQPPEWARVGVAFEDQYIRVLRDAVRFPDGLLRTYIRLVPPRRTGVGVAILPVHAGRIVLVHIFRHATRSWHWEIPRGFGEPEASCEENAARELREEIEAEAIRFVQLGQLHANTGLSMESVELIFAELKQYGQAQLHEAIDEVRAWDMLEVERSIGEAKITDAFTIAAWTRARYCQLI
jgi:ADP-ribose pyrophosphatase